MGPKAWKSDGTCPNYEWLNAQLVMATTNSCDAPVRSAARLHITELLLAQFEQHATVKPPGPGDPIVIKNAKRRAICDSIDAKFESVPVLSQDELDLVAGDAEMADDARYVVNTDNNNGWQYPTHAELKLLKSHEAFIVERAATSSSTAPGRSRMGGSTPSSHRNSV
ncbi:hypothetical protein MN608_08620 [Microdochium nivale]|nr:hypothetical protein MN608_08620 [Microdochium nivale]